MAVGMKSSISTSAVALTATSTPLAYGVVLKAKADNSGVVYVGFSSSVTAAAADSTSGYPLSAGEEIFLPLVLVANLTGVYVIASASGQSVFFLAA